MLISFHVPYVARVLSFRKFLTNIFLAFMKRRNVIIVIKSSKEKDAWKFHVAKEHQENLQPKINPVIKSRSRKCNDCNKILSSSSNLKTHVDNIHFKKQLLSCDMCDKNLKTKHHLQRHVRAVHEGQKLFKCENCDKGFSQKQKLIQHISNNHKNGYS